MQTLMKLGLSVWLSIIVFPLTVSAQTGSCCQKGKVIEGQVMQSEMLNRDVSYSVYLPPGYDYSQRSYPVVYLLHGYTDDETAWVQFGQVQMAANKAIANGEISPMVIAMPDAGFFIKETHSFI